MEWDLMGRNFSLEVGGTRSLVGGTRKIRVPSTKIRPPTKTLDINSLVYKLEYLRLKHIYLLTKIPTTKSDLLVF